MHLEVRIPAVLQSHFLSCLVELLHHPIVVFLRQDDLTHLLSHLLLLHLVVADRMFEQLPSRSVVYSHGGSDRHQDLGARLEVALLMKVRSDSCHHFSPSLHLVIHSFLPVLLSNPLLLELGIGPQGRVDVLTRHAALVREERRLRLVHALILLFKLIVDPLFDLRDSELLGSAVHSIQLVQSLHIAVVREVHPAA